MLRVDGVNHQVNDVVLYTGERDYPAGAALPPSPDVLPDVDSAFIGGLLTGGRRR